MADVDIVVPVFDQTKTLPQCLESIFSQTFSNFTVTVVDDGSVKPVPPVLTPYQNRVTYIRQKNAGAAAARNRGAKEGSAPYILFCDADSTLQSNFISTLKSRLELSEKFSYAYSNFKWGWKTFRPNEFSADRLRREPYINTHSLLRREHFPGFDESLKRFQDWDLWLTMLEQGHTGVWVDEVLFTVQPGGTMSRWLPKAAYQLLPWLPAVKKYRQAAAVIQRKHHLTTGPTGG